MMWFKVILIAALEIFLLLSVDTVPFNNRYRNKFRRDVESVVSSSAVKVSEKNKNLDVGDFETYSKPVKFKWSSNTSFMEDMDDMFASIERELDELLNTTKTKISNGFGFKDEFFSFSFSESESDSASASDEQTPPPEPAE